MNEHHHDPGEEEKTRDRDETCCICLEPLFFHIKPVLDLRCGHSIHHQCWVSSNTIQCPLCKRTGIDMDWGRVDEWFLALAVTEEDTAVKEVRILCNDCLHTSMVKYHPCGHKCPSCGSYNSSVV